MSNSFVYGSERSHGKGTLGSDSHHEITPQSLITAQYDFQQNITEKRSSEPGPNFLGVYRKDQELCVKPNEFFFVAKNDGVGSATTAFSGSGFSSFNGIPTDNIKNDDELWDHFACVGITNGAGYIDGEVITKSGIAVQRAGSASLPVNYGTDTFFPGDLIGIELPSIFADKRAKQINSRTLNNHGTGPFRTKLVATPRRVDPEEDVYGIFRSVARNLIDGTIRDDDGNVTYSVPDLVFKTQANTNNLNSKDQMTVRLKQFLSSVSYNAILSAIQLGYVTIAPYKETPSYNKGSHDLLMNELEKINAFKWWNHRWNVANQVIEQLTDANQKNYKAQVDDFARLLSSSLGLTQDVTTYSWLLEDTTLLTDILLRNLGASSGNEKYAQHQSTLVGSDFISNPKGSNRGIFGGMSGVGDLGKQMLDISKSSATQHSRSNGAMLDRALRGVIGTASNTSAPGSVLHLVQG